jgi:hypothetical protein
LPWVGPLSCWVVVKGENPGLFTPFPRRHFHVGERSGIPGSHLRTTEPSSGDISKGKRN